MSGRLVLVTGAARGIGRELCRQLRLRGHRVLAAVRSADDEAGLNEELGDQGEAWRCDVSDAAQVQALFERAAARWGDLDGLVNNAGSINPIGLLGETDPEAWKQTLLTNLHGPYLCTRAALPSWLARGGGIVVNLSSGAAHKPLHGWSAYCASKAGLAMLTRSLHEEYGTRGIHAVGFAPGLVDTGMQAAIRASGLNPVSKIPVGQLSAPALPVAMMVRLLEGAASAYAGMELDARDPALRAALGA